jgi:hypothetical protein
VQLLAIATLLPPVLPPPPMHGLPVASSSLLTLAVSNTLTQSSQSCFSLCPWLLELFFHVAVALRQGRHQMSTSQTW